MGNQNSEYICWKVFYLFFFTTLKETELHVYISQFSVYILHFWLFFLNCKNKSQNCDIKAQLLVFYFSRRGNRLVYVCIELVLSVSLAACRPHLSRPVCICHCSLQRSVRCTTDPASYNVQLWSDSLIICVPLLFSDSLTPAVSMAFISFHSSSNLIGCNPRLNAPLHLQLCH